MSSTLSTLIYEVRRLMGDRKLDDALVSGPQLEELAKVAVDELMSEIGMGDSSLTLATLVADTKAYAITLPSGFQSIMRYKNVVRDIAGDHAQMRKATREEILEMRRAGGDRFGPPEWWAVWESPTGAATLEVYPTPGANDAGKLITGYFEYVHSRPDPWDLTSLFFSPIGMTALQCRVAGAAIAGLDDARLAKLGKTRKYGEDLMARSVSLARDEYFRLHQGDHVDEVVRARR